MDAVSTSNLESITRCLTEKNQLMKHSLTEMRACLFIFQRQERLNREYSSVESVKMDIMRALVKAIRIKVSSKLLD